MNPTARVIAAFVLVAGLGSSCERVDYIELIPDSVTLKQPNNEVWLQTRAMSHTGVQATRAHISWSIKDSSVATVDATGRVRPVKSGRTEVVATYKEKVRAEAPVEVLFVERIDVRPAEIELTDGGDDVELTVLSFDYKGRELADRTATVRALDGKVVNVGGLHVFPLAQGTTELEVQVDNIKRSVKVVVKPAKKG